MLGLINIIDARSKSKSSVLCILFDSQQS
jgi:hypothetical protein